MTGKGKKKQKAARRKAEKLTKRSRKDGPEMERTQALARALPVQPLIDQKDIKLTPVRPNYRTVRAAQGNKKYINVLIDAELQMNVRVRMTTRKLTWETLIEELFRRWLEENLEFCPKP